MRRAGWCGVILFVCAGLSTVATPASAAGSGQFADDQPLVVDLSTMAPGSRVEVAVVNTTPRTAKATRTCYLLQVRGAASTSLTIDSRIIDVPAGRSDTFHLNVEANAVASSGTLVLTGGDGTLAREQIRLVGALPRSTQVGSHVVTPGSFDTLTVRVTSFLPSYFRPMPSALVWGFGFFVALLVSIIALASYLMLRASNRILAALASVTAIVAMTVTLVLAAGWVGSLINGHRDHVAVDAKSWTLSPPAAGAVSGTLVGSNGDSATLAADHAKLRVSGLDSAGTYTGTIDTHPGRDGGDTKVSVAVRDWWPYAVLALATGVLVAYLLTHFWLRRRPVRKVEADVAALTRRLNREESAWQAATVGSGWQASYSFAPQAAAWLDEAMSGAAHDIDAATVKVGDVENRAAEIESVRWRVHRLARQSEELRARLSDVGGDADAARVPGWLAPVLAPLVLTNEAPTTGVISTRGEAVKKAEAFAATLPPTVELLRRLGDRIVRIPDDYDKERQQLPNEYKNQARALLAANDETEVATVATAIRRLIGEIDLLTPVDSGLGGVAFGASAPPRKLLRSVANLQTWLATEAGSATSGKQDPDALIQFAVKVTPTDGDGSLRWRFSDGQDTNAFPAPPSGQETTLTIGHTFATGSGPVVAEVVSESGRRLGEAAAELAPTGRAARLRRALDADERTLTIVAGVLAVGSGMVALYLTNTTWGSASDYVTALLWGSATAEGIRLVSSMVSNIRLPAE